MKEKDQYNDIFALSEDDCKTLDDIKEKGYSIRRLSEVIALEICTKRCRHHYEANKNIHPDDDVICPEECKGCVVTLFTT